MYKMEEVITQETNFSKMIKELNNEEIVKLVIVLANVKKGANIDDKNKINGWLDEINKECRYRNRRK